MKNVIFFGAFGQKTGRAGQIILKLSTNFHAQIGFRRSDQAQSSTLGQPTNGSLVLKYILSETIHAQENGSRGTYFAKTLISNFLKGLTYSALRRHPHPNIHPVTSPPSHPGHPIVVTAHQGKAGDSFSSEFLAQVCRVQSVL